MKVRAFWAFLCVSLLASLAFAQSPGAAGIQTNNPSDSSLQSNQVQNYAPYTLALLPDVPNMPGAEVVLPFITIDNRLAFFTVSQVQQASREKRLLGRPITYGEMVALIGQLQMEADRLKQENEKLWAVVGKPSGNQTVVVQTPPPAPQTAPAPSDAAMKYMLLRQLLVPQRPGTVNVNVRDCTRYPALCVQ